MELKMPATQRDQLLALGAVVAIVAIGIYFYYVWVPNGKIFAEKQARIDTLAAHNNLARIEVARGTASKFKDEAAQYGDLLLAMRTLVPVANEVPKLINQLSTAARTAGLELGGINAPTIISGDVFDTYNYRLTTTGSYHSLAQFLTNVGSLSRIMAPMNVALTASAPKASQRQIPGQQILDMGFDVQTYVAKSSARAP
jgi:type IV pilus assembly protein PilO